ncbi:MAG: S9 family peptidase [Verrucomicrobia bacterium]|nr:S9 family peptidase [Verrucomicrobiota bacterium]
MMSRAIRTALTLGMAVLVDGMRAAEVPGGLTFERLASLRRLSDPQPSPDGRWIACVVSTPDLATNRTDSDVWLVPVGGGVPRKFAASPKHDRHPRWSPDGRWLAFESHRDGEPQVWIQPVDGGEARAVTRLSTGASAPVWSPDGSRIAFLSSVFPEFSGKPAAESERLNRERIQGLEKGQVKARVYDALPVRKWDAMNDGRRNHLFVVSVAQGAAVKDPVDLTPGAQDAVPWSSTFASGDEFAWAADSRSLVHTPSPAPVREESWSTDHNVVSVSVDGARHEPLTTQPAADGCPQFSPDGRWLAYRAQARAGFEADRWQLMLRDLKTGRVHGRTRDWDHSVESIAWSKGGWLVLEAESKGRKLLWRVDPEGDSAPRALTSVGSASDAVAGADGASVVFLESRMDSPAVLKSVDAASGRVVTVWDPNAEARVGWDLPVPESVTVKGAGGVPVQLWILKPPGFDPAKRYPLVFWVHGGPQGAFLDSWSYRWNPQVWAAEGWVLAMPNPRGSTGFGQKFTDDISRDWGGKVFKDLMAALDWCERQPWVDRKRMAAAGASYGGYMMNWFQGRTDRFKTLVTHCGVFEFHSMYGSTDELWFDEWEHGIPWKTRGFDRDSPDRFAARFRTPNLIIHNELDYRVPVGQGLALFTALQRQGVESRLLYFPDEGHWVLKPQNSRLWHATIFEWLHRHLD